MKYLFVCDFDGCLAESFKPSPNGVGVNEAYAYAVKSIFGDAGINIYAKIGGLQNRAPGELIEALFSNGDQEKLIKAANIFFRKNYKSLEGLIPEGKGFPLEWQDGHFWSPKDVVTEMLIRCKFKRLMGEIGERWPRPCQGVLEFFRIIQLEKMGYLVYPEAARVFIDKEMAKGKTLKEIRKDEAEFQKKILKIKIEVEKKAPKNKIVFFDRAVPDSVAYYQIAGLDPSEVLKFCQKKIYRIIFFLEQLSFENDYARTEDNKTIKKLNKLLKESYKNLGYEVIKIPIVSIQDRVKKILNEVKK